MRNKPILMQKQLNMESEVIITIRLDKFIFTQKNKIQIPYRSLSADVFQGASFGIIPSLKFVGNEFR